MSDFQSALSFIVLAVVGVLMGLGSFRSRRNSRLKTELEKADEALERQRDTVKAYSDATSEVSQIQRESDKAYEALDNEVKEAQTSDEPIQKSIQFGNDIVSGFNSGSADRMQ